LTILAKPISIVFKHAGRQWIKIKMELQSLSQSVDLVAELITQSGKIIVFTGAGISTESGIPDFRGPGGLWSRFDPEEFTIQRFMSSAESRKNHWKIFAEGGLARKAEPNSAHYAIAEMEKLGKLDCVITQNVDNLHQKAGNSPEKVFELHGNIRRVRCMRCGKILSMENVLQRLESEEVPDCNSCHGILKPDAVFFGESLSQKTLDVAIQHSRNCNLFIVIGSTLVVYPAAYMPIYALESGANLVIINLGATPLDSRAKVLLSARAGETMSAIVEKVRNRIMS
jgi:NAD-dependent deacetylase